MRLPFRARRTHLVGRVGGAAYMSAYAARCAAPTTLGMEAARGAVRVVAERLDILARSGCRLVCRLGQMCVLSEPEGTNVNGRSRVKHDLCRDVQEVLLGAAQASLQVVILLLDVVRFCWG